MTNHLKTALSGAVAFLLAIASGCSAALGNISESVKDKNIATGSETWGGSIEVGTLLENAYLPEINLWFGKRNVWYISLKGDGSSAASIPAIVKAGRSSAGVEATATGVKLGNAEGK